MSGDTDLLRDPLVVAPGGTSPIAVTLRDDPGTLAVTVRADNPDTPYALLLVADFAPLQPPRFGGGRGQHEMQIGSLPPGDYKVLALDRIDSLEYSKPEVLSQYLARATAVTVSPGMTARVSLDVIRTTE